MIVSLLEVVIDLYTLITEFCFIRNDFTSLYVTSPIDVTVLNEMSGY